IELDAAYQWGMPHLMMGAYYAGRPRLLGGDPVRGLEHFERARQISGGRLALASLFEARYYAVQTLDEPLFERRLEEVLETSPDALPEARLLNLIAREKARALLAAREDIF
ncbi:MAG: TRAP transporter TatT component family protein, partial [Candidatus Eiseniibacteriota bacterium]